MSPKPAADPMSNTPATPTPWLHRLRVWNGEEPDFEELAPDFCAGSAAFANDVKAALRAHATLLHQRDALVKALEWYAQARVTSRSPASPYNCDDGAYARAALKLAEPQP